MKEEKILIGQSDGFIVRLSMYEKIRRINNSTMPTLFALGLSADVETVVDIAAGGYDKLKEVYTERYYEAHPEAGCNEVLRTFTENNIRLTLDTVCEQYKFGGLSNGETNGTAGIKKYCRFNASGLLEIDEQKFEESQKKYATGENAKLYREIEKAVKNLNAACKGFLTRAVFYHLFYFGDDAQLHIKDNIDPRALDEIRNVNRGVFF